jgi:hypothetical protein
LLKGYKNISDTKIPSRGRDEVNWVGGQGFIADKIKALLISKGVVAGIVNVSYQYMENNREVAIKTQ